MNLHDRAGFADRGYCGRRRQLRTRPRNRDVNRGRRRFRARRHDRVGARRHGARRPPAVFRRFRGSGRSLRGGRRRDRPLGDIILHRGGGFLAQRHHRFQRLRCKQRRTHLLDGGTRLAGRLRRRGRRPGNRLDDDQLRRCLGHRRARHRAAREPEAGPDDGRHADAQGDQHHGAPAAAVVIRRAHLAGKRTTSLVARQRRQTPRRAFLCTLQCLDDEAHC